MSPFFRWSTACLKAIENHGIEPDPNTSTKVVADASFVSLPSTALADGAKALGTSVYLIWQHCYGRCPEYDCCIALRQHLRCSWLRDQQGSLKSCPGSSMLEKSRNRKRKRSDSNTFIPHLGGHLWSATAHRILAVRRLTAAFNPILGLQVSGSPRRAPLLLTELGQVLVMCSRQHR